MLLLILYLLHTFCPFNYLNIVFQKVIYCYYTVYTSVFSPFAPSKVISNNHLYPFGPF